MGEYLALMQKIIIVFAALVLLGGCSRHYHPLEASKKARLVAELISSAARCDDFRDRLASPIMDDDAIDDVYHEATKAQCLNKDV